MSRLHGRSPCDWTLTAEYDPGAQLAWIAGMTPGPVRYLLSLQLTHEQAYALMNAVNTWHGSPGGDYRGCPDFTSRAGGSLVEARNIELTAAEADQVAHGASPLDILFGWAELGYRLTVVPDSLTGRN